MSDKKTMFPPVSTINAINNLILEIQTEARKEYGEYGEAVNCFIEYSCYRSCFLFGIYCGCKQSLFSVHWWRNKSGFYPIDIYLYYKDGCIDTPCKTARNQEEFEELIKGTVDYVKEAVSTWIEENTVDISEKRE